MSWKETDPLSVWKSSTIVPVGPNEAKLFEHTTPQTITSERPRLWQSISELRGRDQTNYMTLLIRNWPYKWERRAFEMPVYFASFTNSWVSLYLANKLVSKAFYDHINVGFWESIRRTSKAPFVLAFYTGCLTTIGMWSLFVRSPMINEEAPSMPRLLVNSYLIMALSGVGMPLLTTPWIVHYMAANEGIGNVHPKNMLEALIINYKFSKPLVKLMPKLFAIQFVVASVCVYSSFWARGRIFDTFDVDPEIIRTAVNAGSESPWNDWAQNKLQNLMVAGSTKDTSILDTKDNRKKTPPLERFRQMFKRSEKRREED